MYFVLMTIQLAFRILTRNRLRTGLTMLGIVIGVGAVVAMVSLGQGAGALVQAQIASLGTNVIIVIPGAMTVGGVRTGTGGVSTLTVADAREILKRVSGVSALSYAIRAVLQVVHENKNWSTVVVGTTTIFPIIRDWPMAQGSFFTQADEDSGSKVAVLGRTAVENLFEPGEEVVGGQIRINNVPFRVLGVLTRKGQTMQGQDQDDVVFIPFSTAERKVIGTKFLGTIGVVLVATERRELIPEVVQDLKELLRTRHRIQPKQDDDFTIRSMEDVASASAGASRTMMIMLLSIASISLVVGGIGIMNILLVSVTERTREIGLRLAIGAKRWQILLQFLSEAVIISMASGIIGVGVGIVAAYVLTHFAGWPIIIAPQAAVIAFFFSVVVGIVFGLYPANKASLMNPIDALRYE